MEGYEVGAEVDVLDTVTTSANYTYTETENFQTHRLLPREPRHRVNLRVAWRPIQRLEVFGEGEWVSEQFELVANNAYRWNSAYYVLNTGGTYRLFNRFAFIQGVDLWARVNNLTNESYSEVRGFPALGINAVAGLRVSF